MSQVKLGISQIGIPISDFPNCNFWFGMIMSQTWSCFKFNLEYPKSDLGHSQVWVSYTPNLTMFQTNPVSLVYGQVWNILYQTQPYPKLTWNMVRFEESNVPNLPCPKLNLGYPKSEFRFRTSQTEISILDDHVLNLTWNIPNWTWGMVKFGTFDVPNLTVFKIYLG